jgi:hypothetical protein
MNPPRLLLSFGLDATLLPPAGNANDQIGLLLPQDRLLIPHFLSAAYPVLFRQNEFLLEHSSDTAALSLALRQSRLQPHSGRRFLERHLSVQP